MKLFASTLLLAVSFVLMAGSFSDIVKSSGIKGGIIVHLNCGDGSEIAGFEPGKSYLVQGLNKSYEEVTAVRKILHSNKNYGNVTIAYYNGKVLPYVDNSINLIVADSLGDVSKEEAMRVLTPLGVMIVGGEKTLKPWPKNIDDWPQYMNKADNNGVAMDSVIGPPRRLQWSGDLRWARSHMGISTTVSMVTGNGRLFSIEDRQVTDNPFLPSEFSIVARNAFNGKKLWIKKITQWDAVTMYIKCLPVQQQRRMAVVGDTLYCTFELEGAVSAVDAATGKVLKTYKNTSPCQEVAYDQGILFLNVGERFNASAYNIIKKKGRDFGKSTKNEPFAGSGFKKGYAPEIKDKAVSSSVILAVDAKTGKQLWKTGNLKNYTGASLSVKGDYAVYQTSEGLFCVNSKTGKSIWEKKKKILNPLGHDSGTPGTLPNTVVITDDKVFAVEANPKKLKTSTPPNNVFAYSLKDGKDLWNAPCKGNYESSSDVFYIDGKLWVGGAGYPICYDAQTGKEIKKLNQKMNGPMSHDRCYRNMITSKYYINSKTGGADFLNLVNNVEIPNYWTRGGCGMGVLPANGLLYSSPYSCTCSIGSMFPGLNAYSSMPGIKKSDDPVDIKRSVRLEKGPAYAKISGKDASENDWPVFRFDASRVGVSKTAVSAKVKPMWQVKLPANPSAMICVGNNLFVCDVDTHTLYSIDADVGKVNWTFTTGGRIDSPPVYYKGMVLFGSYDGWIYCLRASDGVLAWRFKDLPDRMIQVRNQLESAWPVSGSPLLLNDKIYFAAGRMSFLDGGIFLYSMDPATGKVLNSRNIYGPFDKGTGFPSADKNSNSNGGFRNDILVTDGTNIYLRHRAFDLELKDSKQPKPHIMPLSGFLDRHIQYRTGWIVGTQFQWWPKNVMDILLVEGEQCYYVLGFPEYHNHSYFDPRQNSYKLVSASIKSTFSSSKNRKGRGKKAKGKKKEVASGVKPVGEGWTKDIPINGEAIAKASDIIFVAGEPMKFDNPSYKNYVAAYNGKLGGKLLAVSAKDGKILSEYKLKTAPVWDSIAIANGKLFIALRDGTVECFK